MRHSIAPDEVVDDDFEPGTLAEYFARVEITGKGECWAISGRLASIAKGAIRTFAEGRCVNRKGEPKPGWKFHGVLAARVATIRQAGGDVVHTPSGKDSAHASLCYQNLPLVDGLVSIGFCYELCSRTLGFVPGDSATFIVLDPA